MPAEPSHARWPLIETVVTTTAPDGAVNCAAMGVRWGGDEVVFWPFDSTRTLRNLRARPEAVAHLTDDVLLFVQAALGDPQPPVRAAQTVRGSVIECCSAWRELVVTEISPRHERPRARGCEPASSTRGGGNSRRPGCVGPGTRRSRRRSSPRGCDGSAPNGSRPSSTVYRI